MPAKEGAALSPKFIVWQRKGGRLVEWPAFVLRIDGTDPAAMEALRAYALATKKPNLAGDLGQILADCGYDAWTAIFNRHGLSDIWPPREEDDKEVPGHA